jgi:hypothetical protein
LSPVHFLVFHWWECFSMCFWLCAGRWPHFHNTFSLKSAFRRKEEQNLINPALLSFELGTPGKGDLCVSSDPKGACEELNTAVRGEGRLEGVKSRISSRRRTQHQEHWACVAELLRCLVSL